MIESQSERLTIPAPVGPCRNCVLSHDQAATVGRYRTVYCKHNLVGSVLVVQDGEIKGPWVSYSPITQDEFVNAVIGAVENDEGGPVVYHA